MKSRFECVCVDFLQVTVNTGKLGAGCCCVDCLQNIYQSCVENSQLLPSKVCYDQILFSVIKFLVIFWDMYFTFKVSYLVFRTKFINLFLYVIDISLDISE